MAIINFPPVETADPKTGLLAIGGDLEVSSLILAYKNGIFPWPLSEKDLYWFSPKKRAILFFDKFHISKSLKKTIRQNKFTTKKNQDFEKVITACAKTPRSSQSGTWITDNMIQAYTRLYQAGYAWCFSVYEESNLIGGIYGVQINKMFAAESMFHLATDASKVALYYLVEELKSKNISWLDVQIQNDFLKTLGVSEISQKDFLLLLRESLASGQ